MTCIKRLNTRSGTKFIFLRHLWTTGPCTFDPHHDKTSKISVRPAKIQISWASAQSDQSLRCPHEESLGPLLPTERTAKTLIRLGGCPAKTQISLGGCDAQADLSLRWAHTHFVDFVISWLIWTCDGFISRVMQPKTCLCKRGRNNKQTGQFKPQIRFYYGLETQFLLLIVGQCTTTFCGVKDIIDCFTVCTAIVLNIVIVLKTSCPILLTI